MTCKDIFNGSTGNRAVILILEAGEPKTGVAGDAVGLVIAYRVDAGSEAGIDLNTGNWFEIGGGKYLVDVDDSVYLEANLGKFIQFYGSLPDCAVYGEQHRVVANNPSALVALQPDQPVNAVAFNGAPIIISGISEMGVVISNNSIASAEHVGYLGDSIINQVVGTVTDLIEGVPASVAQYNQRYEEGTPGTIGWYFKKLRQASNTVEALVTNDITPTATTFSVSLTTYPTGAFKHSVLAVIEDGAILDQNSPILTFTNNTTYSTIVLEEALTQAPAVGNAMLINVVSHVHSVASIAAGVWGATSSAYSAATGTFGYVVNALSTMIEYVGGVFRWKASSATVITDEIASVESKVDDVLTGVNSLNNNDRGAFF